MDSASASSAAPSARARRDRERRILLHARSPWTDGDVAADLRREGADDLADGRREDVDAADDEHVVGAPDAADPRAGAATWHGLVFTSTWSRVRKRRSGAARWRRCVSTSSPVAPSASGIASAVAGSMSSRWTKPRAPRCIPSCSSHSPQRDTPMSPTPIASVTFARPSRLRAWGGSRLAAAGLARDEDTRDGGAAGGRRRARRPLDQVRGVGRREHDRLGPRAARRREQAARCSRCRRGCARGRCARTRRGRRRRRTGRRCTW